MIPIVDMGELGVHVQDPSEDEWQRAGKLIVQALSDVGFVYLSNHGIPEREVVEVNKLSGTFFELDKATKLKYQRSVQTIQGYTAVDQERLSGGARVCEVRESYDVQRVEGDLPEEEVPGLRPALEAVVASCHRLAARVLTAIALGLGLEESFFVRRHQNMFTDQNTTSIRLLYYPPLPTPLPPDATRTAPHTDYGTITLLFQDAVGGLEVRDQTGAWVRARSIPATVLVNVGDLLQFWTSNRLRATEHRVVCPKEEGKQQTVRRSLVCFVHPDDSEVIKPLDGSSTYCPVLAKEHTERRFAQTYQY